MELAFHPSPRGEGRPSRLRSSAMARMPFPPNTNSVKIPSTVGARSGSGSRSTLCRPRSAIVLDGLGRKRLR
jgi:hypothetical protein